MSIVTSGSGTEGNLSNTNFATLEANNIYLEGLNNVTNSNSSTIEADNDLSIVSKNFVNIGGNATIEVANNLNIIATDSFANTHSLSTPGTINADTFTLSVGGDFDYGTDYINNGTINADSQNFIVGGAFNSNNTNITLTNGDLGITADTFSNTANIRLVNGDLGITTANAFTNTTNITLEGDLGITANTFTNTSILIVKQLT